MRNHLKCFALIALIVMLVSACGFKKSGSLTFPVEMQPLSLQINDRYGTLAKNLSSQLMRFNISFTFNQPQNRFALSLQEHVITARILTISTNTRIRQVRLEYILNYSLTAPSGESILTNHTITIVRIHNENLDTLLGTHHDRQTVEDEMKKEAIAALLNQINSKEVLSAMQKYSHPDYYEN